MSRVYPESVFQYFHHSVEEKDKVCERKKDASKSHFLIATPLTQTAIALSASDALFAPCAIRHPSASRP